MQEWLIGLLVGMGIAALYPLIKTLLPREKTRAWSTAAGNWITKHLRGRFGGKIENLIETTSIDSTCYLVMAARKDNTREQNADILPTAELLVASLKGEAI